MPSSYTSSLNIEKPANGEEDGTWGNIVNANMEIVDRATDGQTSQALTGTSSTFSVTTTAGQRKILILTGSPSGTHTLTLSPNTSPKIYFVRNTTAQSVIFTQGSGGNITVAAGGSAILYADGVGAGSAVLNLSDYFSMSSVKVTGGAIDGTPVGVTTNAAGRFTDLTATSTVTFTGTTVTNGGSVTTVDINGGTVDGATIGATTASTGRFTSVASDSLTNTANTRGPTLTKGYVETVFALTGTTPALNPANGTIQTWTLTANSTPTDSFAAGESITLMIDDGTTFTVTWPSVTWKTNAGIAPTLNPTGLTAIVLWKVGTVLYGARVGDA